MSHFIDEEAEAQGQEADLWAHREFGRGWRGEVSSLPLSPALLHNDSVRGVELDLPMEQLHVAAFASLAET